MIVNINGKPFFRITSEFGVMDTSIRENAHSGIDLATFEGTPLINVSDGVVTQIYRLGDKNVGNGIKVENSDGVEIIYGHLSEISVKVGDKVDIGQIIGKTGNTGNSTGPHLHLGAKLDGKFIDPQQFVDTMQSLAHQLLDSNWMTIHTVLGFLKHNIIT